MTSSIAVCVSIVSKILDPQAIFEMRLKVKFSIKSYFQHFQSCILKSIIMVVFLKSIFSRESSFSEEKRVSRQIIIEKKFGHPRYTYSNNYPDASANACRGIPINLRPRARVSARPLF